MSGEGEGPVNNIWLDDYYQQWLYDQDLIDRANDELTTTTQEHKHHA
jgi:hypothetical protein